jgi:hypothetical protein
MLFAHIVDTLHRPIGDPHAGGSEAEGKTPFGSLAPTDCLTSGTIRHRLCRYRLHVRDMALAGTTASRDREDHGNLAHADLSHIRSLT